MDNEVTYLSEIISALKYYDGMASLKEINIYIEKNDVLPYIHTNRNWKRNVSSVIQDIVHKQCHIKVERTFFILFMV